MTVIIVNSRGRLIYVPTLAFSSTFSGLFTSPTISLEMANLIQNLISRVIIGRSNDVNENVLKNCKIFPLTVNSEVLDLFVLLNYDIC